MTPNIRMHLTGYSGLRPLPPAGDAGRWASTPGINASENTDPGRIVR